MKNLFKYHFPRVNFILLTSLLLSCTSLQRTSSASYFRFSMDDEIYKIRSVNSVETDDSYNELIGKNFVALDFDRDRIIDFIAMGESSLSEAQKIYEYGLNILILENKVSVVDKKLVAFFYYNTEYDYQIISFHPEGSNPFNEFKIIKKSELSVEPVVLVDQNANGYLDEILKGTNTINHFQERYTFVLNEGLLLNKLKKDGDRILVNK